MKLELYVEPKEYIAVLCDGTQVPRCTPWTQNEIIAMDIEILNERNRKEQQEQLAKVRLAESKRQLLDYEKATRIQYTQNLNHYYPNHIDQFAQQTSIYEQMMYTMNVIQNAQISSCWTMTDAQVAQIQNMQIKVS